MAHRHDAARPVQSIHQSLNDGTLARAIGAKNDNFQVDAFLSALKL
jgi:hypothetical protein